MEDISEPSKNEPQKVSIEDAAKAFLEFQYAEAKDLTKHFLTVVATVLTVSVTFSEKIISDKQVASLTILVAWVLFIIAFIVAGAALYLLFNAGAAAKRTILTRQKHVFDF